ncbi:barrier-to-autointegration factor-like [Calliphora vicina]|uniref:barrier-to-autointegration factor-like n=1 Tax=Calliphora vicina TaxID=7373 RepID=UPI00325AE9CF
MATTSKKHRDFVSDPMGEKPVTDLAGIGTILGDRLNEAGFNKANAVLGQYLVLQRNEYRFTEWIQTTCNANSKQAKDCFNCLNEWCDRFL